MKRFLCNFIAALTVFCLCSFSAYAAELEKSNNFGYIYWYGGEDVSYNKDTSDLVSIADYDTEIDMYIDMDLADMEADDGAKSYVNKTIPTDIIKGKSVKTPEIAIVIDDMGVNGAMTSLVLNKIKQPITMSFLPYSYNIQAKVDRAKTKGHEIILHLPWEPERETANSGPNSLMFGDEKETIETKLEANLNSFTGYSGVNNHMGSKFSLYREGIETVMSELHNKGLFFLDSKTADDSIAEKIAYEYGVPATHRNVFLDHVETKEFVSQALREVERIALKTGSAVAIGHPKAVTVEALEKWIPTLKARGFKLVKLEDIIKLRQNTFNAKLEGIENKAKN